MTRYTRISLAAVALVLVFAAGRWTAPVRVETREVEKVRTVAAKQTEDRRASASETVLVTRWRTRALRLPDGTTSEEFDGVVRDAAREHAASGASEAEIRTVEVVKEVEKIKIVEARDTWTLGAYGGLQWDGSRVYGGRIERRILGPLSIGAQADNRAAMVTVGWSW